MNLTYPNLTPPASLGQYRVFGSSFPVTNIGNLIPITPVIQYGSIQVDGFQSVIILSEPWIPEWSNDIQVDGFQSVIILSEPWIPEWSASFQIDGLDGLVIVMET